ncbi:MAG: hypothetical protein ACLSAF_07765 [Intestinimonas sp.]
MLTAGQWMERYRRGGGSPRAGCRGGERGVLHAPQPDEADLRRSGATSPPVGPTGRCWTRHRSLRGPRRAPPARRFSNEELTATSTDGVHRRQLEYQNVLTLDDAGEYTWAERIQYYYRRRACG